MRIIYICLPKSRRVTWDVVELVRLRLKLRLRLRLLRLKLRLKVRFKVKLKVRSEFEVEVMGWERFLLRKGNGNSHTVDDEEDGT